MKFNHNKFEQLAKVFSEKNTKVSIYIPSDRVGDGQAAKIRLKNQLNEVVDKLMDTTIQATPLSRNEALEHLSNAFALLDDDNFWSHQSDGLALFISENTFDYFTMPTDFNAFNYVGSVFYLRPMLPAITDESRFFILALSQNEVRFFEGAKHSITPVIIGDLVPESLEASMATIDIEYPATLQAHSGGSNPIFHGQGGEKDGKDARIIDYFRMIDDGLMEMLHDENVPLIIAAVDYLVPMYKNISNYKNIVDTHISGNVESDDPVLLHEKAINALEDVLTSNFRQKCDLFAQTEGQQTTSLETDDIIPAALNGKIDTLFLDKNVAPIWGTYQEDSNSIAYQISQNKTNSCLLNFAAITTYLQGGTVYNIERSAMPNPASLVNAIYRY